jgi:hypothetical protein
VRAVRSHTTVLAFLVFGSGSLPTFILFSWVGFLCYSTGWLSGIAFTLLSDEPRRQLPVSDSQEQNPQYCYCQRDASLEGKKWVVAREGCQEVEFEERDKSLQSPPNNFESSPGDP